MVEATSIFPVRRLGEPPWEIAQLFPTQGSWNEQEYLALKTKRLVEFDNGIVEVLPLPKRYHQILIGFFYILFKAFLARETMGGVVLLAGYKLRIPTGKYREPDIIYLTAEQNAQANEDFSERAEWVLEVVSQDDPDRDYVAKRKDYATAAVPEYWIVDPERKEILVLVLADGAYAEEGRFGPGQRARSHRFPALAVSVDEMLNEIA